MAAITSAVLGATAAAVGAGLQIKNAMDQADNAEAQAEIQRQQAAEVLRRSEVNAKAAQEQAQQIREEQISSYAKSGVDAFSGSPILFMEETARRAKRDIQNIRDEAAQKARMILMGADNISSQAGDIRTAGAVAGVGTLLTGTYNLLNASGAFGKGS